MKHLVILVGFFVACVSVKLPTDFQKCKRYELEWKQCVLKAALHGLKLMNKPLPELNVPNLEPLFIPQIDIDAGSQTIQLTQHFYNATLYGLTNLKEDSSTFDFDFDNKVITIETMLPEIRIPGMYKFDGKVLLLPIVGEGFGETTLKDLYAKAVLRFEEVNKKGKSYIHVVSGTIKLIPGFMHFQFDNLFNGDKSLGDNINSVLNDNWKVVFEDIEAGYSDLVLKIFTNLVNGFFSKVSIAEAFD